MNNVIECRFDPEFRYQIAMTIKQLGVVRTRAAMRDYHPAFAGGLIRSIMRREGW